MIAAATKLRPQAKRILRFIPALADNATTVHRVAQLAGQASPRVRKEMRYLERRGIIRRLGTGVQAGWVRNNSAGGAA